MGSAADRSGSELSAADDDERGRLGAALATASTRSGARSRLANPLADVGPLLFVKRVPSGFSHQLTQYYGRRARPGGGVFVLDAPGESMQCRQLDDAADGQLPASRRLLGRPTRAVRLLRDRSDARPTGGPTTSQFYHLYEMAADGSGLRQLTDGPYDDFSPRYLPDGKLLFLSTRRGGFHRCGRGPVPGLHAGRGRRRRLEPAVDLVPRDARMGPGRAERRPRHLHALGLRRSPRRPLPAAVDRAPDGSDVRIFYGNNTLNPVGVWEARPCPARTA